MTNIKDQMEKLGPWVSKFSIDGVDSGGWFDVFSDVRVTRWLETVPKHSFVIECGSLEGGHTAIIAKSTGVKKVVGLEAREANLAKCRFLHELLQIKNSEFVQCDLDKDHSFYGTGNADACFCSGVFYHLERPVEFFKKIVGCPYIFLGTHYSAKSIDTLGEAKGVWYSEHGIEDVLSGMGERSFWMTLPSIVKMASDHGYEIYELSANDQQNGPWVNMMMRME